jgi:predicted ATPase
MKKIISTIETMKINNVFKNYIDYIRFPKFRNLEDDTKISFDFPLTFFVGKNGSGKSSTLHSLFGAPKNYSTGNYWFTTELDPIKEFKDNRNCFIYSFDNKEVLKQRSKRKGNPDYWEPSRPLKKYSMDTSKRYSPIEKEVIYIDFRSELSAFDSFMYFTKFQASAQIKTKQDYVRRYSKHLKKAFTTKSILSLFRIVKNQKPISLTKTEIKNISFILGKEYIGIEIIEHNFFKNWGFSIRLTSPKLTYTEAFAGSGETAIITLVNKIHNASDFSLLLLDEPEVSLHPGAQKKLRLYLLEQIKLKKLQVVISTHSPFFIESMPANSIKVFTTNVQGKFHIENERHPKEAFYELEVDNNRHQIIVEDDLAKIILEEVLKDLGDDVYNSFKIDYLPGGSSSLKQKIATYMELDNNLYIMFDGDQKKVDNHINYKELPQTEIDTSSKLNEIIKKQTESQIEFYPDGTGGVGNEEQKISLMKTYLEYYFNNVFYFPLNIPEDIIWSDKYAINRLNDFGFDKGVLAEIKKGDSKNWFYNLSIKTYGDTDQIKSYYLEFSLNWLRSKDANYKRIIEFINKIKASG